MQYKLGYLFFFDIGLSVEPTLSSFKLSTLFNISLYLSNIICCVIFISDVLILLNMPLILSKNSEYGSNGDVRGAKYGENFYKFNFTYDYKFQKLVFNIIKDIVLEMKNLCEKI